MATTNDVTGDEIKSRGPSKEYLSNYENIFRKKDKEEVQQEEVKEIQPESSDN